MYYINMVYDNKYMPGNCVPISIWLKLNLQTIAVDCLSNNKSLAENSK